MPNGLLQHLPSLLLFQVGSDARTIRNIGLIAYLSFRPTSQSARDGNRLFTQDRFGFVSFSYCVS